MLFTDLNLSPSKTNENRCLMNDWTFVQRFLSFKNFFFSIFLAHSLQRKRDRKKENEWEKQKKLAQETFLFKHRRELQPRHRQQQQQQQLSPSSHGR